MEKHFPTSFIAGKTIHLGVTGSIAAYKALELLRAFHKAGARVNVTLTEAAQRFVTPLSFKSLGAERVYASMFGQESFLDAEADPFGHLAPGTEADIFLIAPVSATTMSRIVQGSADEILSAQALSWPGKILMAPSMNPRMWQNNATQANVAVLRSRGHVVLQPDSGLVACGEVGDGRFPDLRVIFLHCLQGLAEQDLSGKKVMLTLGPTREAWDGVRFWSNQSTGLMGAALAVAAWLRGAEVHAVCGPGSPWLPPQIKRYDVSSAMNMFEAASGIWPVADIGIFTAAVADFAPDAFGSAKFKKSDVSDGFDLHFHSNPDILATLGKSKKDKQKIIGFAAETDHLEENIRRKLKVKNADMIVGNQVGVPDSGFAGTNNTALIIDNTGRLKAQPTMPKPDLAWRILDWLCSL